MLGRPSLPPATNVCFRGAIRSIVFFGDMAGSHRIRPNENSRPQAVPGQRPLRGSLRRDPLHSIVKPVHLGWCLPSNKRDPCAINQPMHHHCKVPKMVSIVANIESAKGRRDRGTIQGSKGTNKTNAMPLCRSAELKYKAKKIMQNTKCSVARIHAINRRGLFTSPA